VADWGARELVAVTPDEKAEVVVRFPFPSFQAICIDWLSDGRLLAVSSRDAVLLPEEPNGSMATHADLTRISDRGWNEIVVDGRGNALRQRRRF